MSFPVAHLYKQFFGQANTEIQCTTLQSNTKEKLVLRLCANFTTCLPAVYYYNVFVTKKYPKPPYTLHTFKTHTEEENWMKNWKKNEKSVKNFWEGKEEKRLEKKTTSRTIWD